MLNNIIRRAGALAAVAVCLSAGGCTTVVDGAAIRAPGGPPPGAIDVSLLDPGNYPTTPRPPLGVAGSPSSGAILEAQRMAEFVIDPSDVDAAIVTGHAFGFSPGAMVLKSDPGALAEIMPDEMAQACGQHNYVNGFVVAREDTNHTVLYNAVIRMADPDAAGAAATDMSAAALTLPTPTPAAVLPIPDHPDTTATSYTAPRSDGQQWSTVKSFTARGPYVLYQRVETTDAAEAAAALVGTALDLQGPLIDRFEPTDPAQFADLPRDPSGVLAKALPIADKDATVLSNGTWGPRAAAHLQYDPLGSAKAFADAGMDAAVSPLDWVYQARDPAAATALANALYTEAQPMGKAADPVPNLKASHCLQFGGNQSYYCAAAAGRYAVEVTSAQLRDAHQQVAAQYLLLVGK